MFFPIESRSRANAVVQSERRRYHGPPVTDSEKVIINSNDGDHDEELQGHTGCLNEKNNVFLTRRAIY